MKWIIRRVVVPDAAASEAGVTAIEYGLIAALIAVAIITAVALIGTNLSGVFTNVSGHLT